MRRPASHDVLGLAPKISRNRIRSLPAPLRLARFAPVRPARPIVLAVSPPDVTRLPDASQRLCERSPVTPHVM